MGLSLNYYCAQTYSLIYLLTYLYSYCTPSCSLLEMLG